VEAFDVLAEITLKDHPEKESIQKQIFDITNQGMDGSCRCGRASNGEFNFSPLKKNT